MQTGSNDRWKAWGIVATMLLLSCGYLLFLGYRLCMYGEW